jgi:hypothetical protein
MVEEGVVGVLGVLGVAGVLIVFVGEVVWPPMPPEPVFIPDWANTEVAIIIAHGTNRHFTKRFIGHGL